jgi:gluconate 2-dehydrogenase subunit 3-like protein
MAEKQPKKDVVSRRAMLKVIAGSAGAAVGLPVLNGATPHAAVPHCHVAHFAGQQAVLPAPKFFNEPQIRTLDALTETLIPTDDHSPGAKAARVWEYIDEIVSDADKDTKDLWTQGLAALNGVAKREHGKNFEDCTADQQVVLVERISQNEDRPTRPEEHFFVAAKRATIDGYYTSAIGIHQDLRYQGNTALSEFPGCTHPEHKV